MSDENTCRHFGSSILYLILSQIFKPHPSILPKYLYVYKYSGLKYLHL